MRRHSWSRVLVLLALALAGAEGCALVRTPPPDLPSDREVEQIAIETNKKLGTPAADRVIEDREQIRRITRFLDAHEEDWREARMAFPTAFYSVRLGCGSLGYKVVWIGRDWIGTTGEGLSLYRMLTTEEAREFRELLGLPAKP
jgi:hypothetical protein